MTFTVIAIIWIIITTTTKKPLSFYQLVQTSTSSAQAWRWTTLGGTATHTAAAGQVEMIIHYDHNDDDGNDDNDNGDNQAGSANCGSQQQQQAAAAVQAAALAHSSVAGLQVFHHGDDYGDGEDSLYFQKYAHW